MHYRTSDKGSTGPPGFHTTEQIGPKRHMTPEGFMLCLDVPVARVGWMIYLAGETPIEPGREGYAMVNRTPATLFNPKTIASGEGKDITEDHPPDGVDSKNRNKLSVGEMHNVRRGTGDDNDVLLADLLVKDDHAIREIKAGKVEVSLGYDADYEQIDVGVGEQTDIIINHIALVDRGRCGPRCAIGDHLPPQLRRKETMTASVVKPRRQIGLTPVQRQRVVDAAIEGMEGALSDPIMMDGNEGPDEGGESHIHVHVHQGGGGTPAQGNGIPPAEGVPPPLPSVAPGVTPTPDAPGAPSAAPAAAGGDLEGRVAAIEQTLQQIVAMLGGDGDDDDDEGGEAPEGGEEGDEPTGDAMEGAMPDQVSGPEGHPTGGTEEFPDVISGPDSSSADELSEIPDPRGKDPDDMVQPKGFKDKKTGDSRAFAGNFRAVLADAEVLVPGFRMPTFDAKLPRAKTIDMMCRTRKRALDAFMQTNEGNKIIRAVAGKTVDCASLSCADAAMLFRSAAAVRKLGNQRAATGDSLGLPSPTPASHVGPMTISQINEINRKVYPKR